MNNKELLIFAEYSNNKIHPVTYELLNKGKNLADKAGLKLSVLLIAPREIETDELIFHGADKVYLLENKKF